MSSQSSNTESLSRFPLWQVITPVRRKVILAMALAGLAALTSLGALLFLAWSLRDIRATPDAIPAWPLGGVIGCVVLTFVLRLQAFNTSHYAAFHLENILRSRLARKALQLPPGVLQQMGSGSVAKVMLDDVKSLHILWPTARRSMPARSSCRWRQSLSCSGWTGGWQSRRWGYWRLDRLFSCSPAGVRKIWLSVIIRRASRLARRLLSSCRPCPW